MSQGRKRISCSWGIWAELARSSLWPSSCSVSLSILITLDDDEWFFFDIRTTFMVSTCSEIRSELPEGQVCWNAEVTVGRG